MGESHIKERWVKVPAEALGWGLAPGKEGLSGLLHHRKPTRNGFAEAGGFIHHIQLEYRDKHTRCYRFFTLRFFS